MEQSYSTSELRPVVCLFVFRKASGFHEFRKVSNVGGKEYRIMDKLFMALIAVSSSSLLQFPFVFSEKRIAHRPWTIDRSSEETLGHIMMFGRVRATLHGRFGIIAVAMKLAAAKSANFL